ncbi:LOW QUALITY PROTEIN: histone-lysine N-methyltransferase SETDB2 [Chionomys nivalis]|uniref:LOW QUALITY PROTEIN: histone-lysine N-methyltransferase SETDB2 n=1 Tax=Chionomys nivalis TaxID=269649 RepID=UPI002597FCD5|nr:LOW QUALITY PROTEIN: histone-lysine N-methyltransferase SETDB2 [Chionomys nivalis]
MGERNGDARTFWLELQDDGKVDFMFEKTQDVLQSLKKKIKDGSATNKDYVQAMILVNEATIRNSATKDHIPVTQTEQEHRSNAFPSTSCENFPEDCTTPSPGQKALLPANSKAADLGEKECPLSSSFQSHICSSACLTETPLSLKGGNPLQRPIRCHFQRRHAKTNSHSSALHVNYKTPCGRSLRNMEEVFHYLIETECNFLFTDNFSFNTYVQLTRNHPKQDEVVSDVDISNGMEPVPISFCNEVDSRKLPQFKYRRTVWPRACYLNSSSMFSVSCDCSEGCIDIQKCACLQLTAKNAKACSLPPDGVCIGYNYKRLQRLIPTGIYECNLMCKCSRQLCQNRVVQHGPQVRLQVFKSEKKGWGVRCLDDIDRGTFVCIYSGRLLSRSTPEKTNTDKNRREQQNDLENELSKKRKIEVACSDCETQPSSPKNEQCSLKFSCDLREPVIEMNYRNISKTQRHSVIRSPKSKTAIFHCNEKDMGFVSSESTAPEDENGFKPAPEHLNSKARAHASVFSAPEMMEKRICVFCPEDHDWSVIYCARSENIAAHENCLLYSSGLVECEDHGYLSKARNFDVKSVKKRVQRGRRLTCTLCNKKGATVGCEEKSCTKSYHFFCAKKDNSVLQVDAVKGTYILFCQQHVPELPGTSQSAEGPSLQKKRGRKKRLPSSIPEQPTNMKFSRSKKRMTEEASDHKDATVKVPFLKKCKEAGLLNELFEGILEKLDSIQEKLLNETASESDYEDIETLLFDCGVFEDTLIKFQKAIKSKACEQEEMQRQLKQQLEALGNLEQTLCSFQENRDLNHSSSTSRVSPSSLFECEESSD